MCLCGDSNVKYEYFKDVRFVEDVERLTRFYHVRVRNLHQQKIARDCVAYLEEIRDLSSGETRTVELVEIKWKGTIPTRVAIPPARTRSLDAFYVHLDSPNTIYLGINKFGIDFTGYLRLYLARARQIRVAPCCLLRKLFTSESYT